MVSFSLPSANPVTTVTVEKLKGVDFFNSPDNVESYRSPLAVNMIRDKSGSVRKRMGYRMEESFGKRLNGAALFKGRRIIHAGNELYASIDGETELVFSEMADEKSVFIAYDEKLYIGDGNEIYVYYRADGDYSLRKLSDIAYVPTVIISKAPAGGGVMSEPFNRIGELWSEAFLGGADDTVYKLSQDNIDGIESVSVMDEKGEFQMVTNYTVDVLAGTVTFDKAPGESFAAGIDNVIITARKKRDDVKKTLCRCKAFAVFGSDGKRNRLFLGGNPDCPSMDFFSAADDFTYFPDVNYSVLSGEPLRITGYSVHDNYLYAHLSEENSYQGVIVARSGGMDSQGNSLFRIVNEFRGEKALASGAFGYFNGEPLYFSRKGVFCQ